MSTPSPVLGKPPMDGDECGWSGTEHQNQKPSKGIGKILIDRGERENAMMRDGYRALKRFRPSGHGPSGR